MKDLEFENADQAVKHLLDKAGIKDETANTSVVQNNDLETFDEKFDNVIDEMQDYLIKNKLSAIKFTYKNGWRFNLSIPRKEYQKLLAEQSTQKGKRLL